jgi:hypothetical protein
MQAVSVTARGLLRAATGVVSKVSLEGHKRRSRQPTQQHAVHQHTHAILSTLYLQPPTSLRRLAATGPCCRPNTLLFSSPSLYPTAAARRAFASAPPSGKDDSHDDFKPQKAAPPADLDGAIKMIAEQVKKHQIMLYMKGTPARPQCGFSAQAVRILHASGVDFDSVNVLDYPMIREGVKKYS